MVVCVCVRAHAFVSSFTFVTTPRLYSVCEQATHRYNYLIVVPNELTNREAFTVLALCCKARRKRLETRDLVECFSPLL